MIKELTIEKTSLPVGWEMKKIDEVVIDYHQGLNTAGQKIKFVDEGYPIIQTRNLNQGEIDISSKIKFMSKVDWELYKDKYKPSVGDVFLTNIGTIGKTAVVTIEEDYLIHWNIFIFKLDKSKVLPLYLKLFLDSPSSFDYYHSFQKGGTVSFITKKMISNLEIPLPPITQQKKIVAILDKAFAAIDTAKANAEQNLQNAKELFESYLQNVFENKGDDWEEKTLGKVTSKIGSGATPRGGKASYKEEGISLIRSMNVHDFYFKKKNLAFIDDKQADALSNVTLQEKDVLLNITGASIARCCMIPKEYLPARVNQHVSIIRAKKDIINPVFLASLLTSKYFKDQILEIGEQGATRQAITKVQLENFHISYPKEIEKQEKVIQNINLIKAETKKLEAIYTQKIADLEEMKKSVLQKAFSGQLNTIN